MKDERRINEAKVFISALLLMFIGLKIANVIDWSWWAVLAPLWFRLLWWLAAIFVIANRNVNEKERPTCKEKLKEFQDNQKQ